MATNSNLTKYGYRRTEATEFKDMLVEYLKKKDSDFFEYSADIQNMLLDTAIAPLMEIENLLSDAINGYSLDGGSEFIFRALASTLNLKQQNATNSQVTLTFGGAAGTIIPKGTSVSGENVNANFETEKDAVITSTGEVSVLAYNTTSTDIVAANTLTQSPIDNVSVTNGEASVPYVDMESYEQFKARVQQNLRSPLPNSIERAVAQITAIQGVDKRLVSVKVAEKTNGGLQYRVIDFVVGGGDTKEIALTLFTNTIETQKLESTCSENELKIKENLVLYGNTIGVEFTRPKQLALELTLNLSFHDFYTTAINIHTYINNKILAWINSLQVGYRLTRIALADFVVDILRENHINSNQIKSLEFACKVNGESVSFNTEGILEKLDYNTYLVLTKFQVNLN